MKYPVPITPAVLWGGKHLMCTFNLYSNASKIPILKVREDFTICVTLALSLKESTGSTNPFFKRQENCKE